MEQSFLTAVLLPLALAFIMMGMGLSLTIDDFRRIFVAPKAILVGLFAQILLLPIVGFIIVSSFGLTGALAVGIMILAACPGGPTSNLVSHLSRGDLALSISLTAISSTITVVTIPLIVNFSIFYFGEEGSVTLPVIRTIGQIVGVTLIPAGIGMFIRNRKPELSFKAEKPVKIASAVFFVLIIAAAIIKERHNLIEFFILTGPPTLLLNVSTMAVGFFLARFFILPIRQRISITIESGIQNGTMGIMIAATLLQNSEMTVPIAIYSLIMFITVFWAILYGNRKVTD